MKIEILCSDGSPLGVTSKTIWGDSFRVGVGGAEYALLTMCETWTEAGHEVILYNNPHEQNASSFEQRAISTFDPKANRDVLIVFRSPNPAVLTAKGLKVWWSCDQSSRGNFKEFRPMVDKVVCISEFHKNYFKTTYNIKDSIVIDLPVRVNDYLQHESWGMEKTPNSFLFSSVPARGLKELLDIWGRIKKYNPDAILTITSDYRLWGALPSNDHFRTMVLGKKDIQFLGAVPRNELIEIELKSEWYVYPCTYDELFCISCSEAQLAGIYPITSNFGALPTTNMGTVLVHDPASIEFGVGTVEELERLEGNKMNQQLSIRTLALNRFHPNDIMEQWENKVFK